MRLRFDSRPVTGAWAFCVAALALLGLAAAADGAFPGANGLIAFAGCGQTDCGIFTMNSAGSGLSQITHSSDAQPAWSPGGTKIAFARDPLACAPPGDLPCNQIWVMNADGSGQTRLTSNDDGATTSDEPVWSPDGTKIAFSSDRLGGDIYVMNADGTDQTPLGVGSEALDPDWSPDGKKIAYRNVAADNSWQIHVMSADGTNQTRLTGPGFDNILPSWAPDGSKIAFQSLRDGNWEIYAMNADGSGQTRLTTDATADQFPAWSPNGAKIAFQSERNSSTCCVPDVYVMNANGSDVVRLTRNFRSAGSPDWQSIPINAYPHPRGASPLRASLVPAFKECSAPNNSHGLPLAFGSCSPPHQASDYLTIGTPDANGRAAKANGFLLIRAFSCPACAGPGPNADVRFDVSITDVRNKSKLSAYAGELQADTVLRITDQNNTPNPGGPGAGTVSDTHFPFTVPCAATSDTTVGSTCSVSTSANAVVPGSVFAGQRAIWELGEVHVYDGGADGLASTTGDNTLFMDQGVFVP